MGVIYLGPGASTETIRRCLEDTDVHTVYLLPGTHTIHVGETPIAPGKTLAGLNENILDILASEIDIEE